VKFELLPTPTAMWRRRGTPLRIATPGKNRRVAVCGAFRWPDGPFRFAYGHKQVNTAVFLALLPRLATRAAHTGKRIVLVLDNGSAFTSHRSRAAIRAARSWLQVVWLPRYSSEQLNDIEALWQHLETDYFSRMLVTDSDTFVPAAVRFLQRLERDGALRRVLKPRTRRRGVGKNL
jgi:transposase